MNKYITLVFLLLLCSFGYSQNTEVENLEKWIKKNDIIFNSPTCPEGFEHFQNCEEIHAYKKVSGDTIIIYSRGSSIAENIETLNKSIKDKGFNTFRYPIRTQKNGTIIIQNMRKWIFLKRKDALYLLDEYDKRKSAEYIKIMNAYFRKEISISEFEKKSKENQNKDFGYKPKYKLIYFKGIFDNSKEYKFNKHENFREEKVTLLNTWNYNHKTYYKINLKTWTAGRYVISEDFDFINTEICEE